MRLQRGGGSCPDSGNEGVVDRDGLTIIQNGSGDERVEGQKRNIRGGERQKSAGSSAALASGF